MSWYNDKGKGGVITIGEKGDELVKINDLVRQKDTILLLFNAKFDLPMLEKVGIRPKCIVLDVMLMCQMVFGNEKTHGLKHMSRKFLKDPYLEEVVINKWRKQNGMKPHGEAPRHIVEPYALADARRTVELFVYLCAPMRKWKLWPILRHEMKLMRVVRKMETAGVLIDADAVDRLSIQVDKRLKKIKDRLSHLTKNPEFNPNSHQQVVASVFDGSVTPVRFSKKTGQPTVDEITLLEQPSEIGSLVVQYRKIAKAKTTYLKNFQKTDGSGRIRVSFNQCGARTGRFSSSGPNLQNIPRPGDDSLGKLRSCFIAEPGKRLIFIDYSQIELRLTAHFSKEKSMLEAINNGYDLHSSTCKKVFNKTEEDEDFERWRYLAKTLNFAIIYGTGADTFRTTVLKNTGGKIKLTLQESADIISNYKSTHPHIEELFSSVINEVSRTGGVKNYYGRFMQVEKHQPYKGVNYKIQSTAADFMKLKMLEVDKFLKDKETRLVLTVHDELAFEVPKSENRIWWTIAEIMEDHTEFRVPLTTSVAIGKNWMDKRELLNEKASQISGSS